MSEMFPRQMKAVGVKAPSLHTSSASSSPENRLPWLHLPAVPFPHLLGCTEVPTTPTLEEYFPRPDENTNAKVL